MVNDDILIDLGFSKNESKIYISLLEKGAATSTEIADISGIHRVNVYDSVGKLKKRGLVAEVMHNGKKCFQAASPEALRNILKEKEIKLEAAMPQFQMFNSLHPHVHNVQVYEGYDFIRNMFLQFLESRQDIYDLQIPNFVLDQMGSYFQEVIHKRRAEQKQMMYHIYSKKALERIKFLNTLPYTEARFLEAMEEEPATTTICGDIVAIQVYYLDQRQKPMTIYIKNAQIAAGYRSQFLLLWSQAKKP